MSFADQGGALGRPKLVVLASGKGGCGRTLIASSVAVYLAQIGHRVCILDLDLGNANLHTLLGVDGLDRTLDDFVHRRTEDVQELLLPTRVDGLHLLSGAYDALSVANMKHGSRTRLYTHLTQMNADFLVADTTVGTGLVTLDLFNMADAAVVVTTPEPTSVERCWRLLCAAFVRRAMRASPPVSVRPILDEALDRPGRPAPTPGALCRAADEVDPEEAGPFLNELRRGYRPGLVVSMSRTPEDGELGANMAVVAQHHLGVRLQPLGTVTFEDAARFSVSRMKPVLLEHPRAQVSRDLEQVVHQLLAFLSSGNGGEGRSVGSFEEGAVGAKQEEP